jgi:hypothetical protein
VQDFHSTLTVPCNFLPLPFSILSLKPKVKWTHPWIVNCYNATEEGIVFISPMLLMGSGKNNMHGSLVIVEHIWNPLCEKFWSPQAVGENTVNTYGRDSNFCRKCHVWNNAHMFKDRYHLLHLMLIFPSVGLHCERHHLFLSGHS